MQERLSWETRHFLPLQRSGGDGEARALPLDALDIFLHKRYRRQMTYTYIYIYMYGFL